MPKKTSYTDAELDAMAHGNPPLPAQPWRITGPISYIGPPRSEEEAKSFCGNSKVNIHGVVCSEWEVDPTHPVLGWHFPNRPIFPGVFGLDQLLQLTGFYGMHNGIKGEGSAVKLGEVKFKAPLTPDAKLIAFMIQITKYRPSPRLGMVYANGRIYADGTLATEAFAIAAAIAPPK